MFACHCLNQAGGLVRQAGRSGRAECPARHLSRPWTLPGPGLGICTAQRSKRTMGRLLLLAGFSALSALSRGPGFIETMHGIAVSVQCRSATVVDTECILASRDWRKRLVTEQGLCSSESPTFRRGWQGVARTATYPLFVPARKSGDIVLSCPDSLRGSMIHAVLILTLDSVKASPEKVMTVVS
ncbi:hypothetical protein BDW74DRAFT_84943 [Aspergillus multicolor]|uniref:uncharacterized protein n=1 Tax=Aspergillus multicolor TaxID=41759 RepID=UPI003CCCB1EA